MLCFLQCILSDITVFTCPITDDIHLNSLIKWNLKDFSTAKLLSFPLLIRKYLVKRYFETM